MDISSSHIPPVLAGQGLAGVVIGSVDACLQLPLRSFGLRFFSDEAQEEDDPLLTVS